MGWRVDGDYDNVPFWLPGEIVTPVCVVAQGGLTPHCLQDAIYALYKACARAPKDPNQRYGSDTGEQETWEDAATRLSVEAEMNAQGCKFEEEPWGGSDIICALIADLRVVFRR